MAALEAAIRVTDAALDGRVKPGHDLGAKFGNA
jgi:hypothetical protein